MYDRVVSVVLLLVGVSQCCNLSPTLFNIFVNDIVDVFDSTCDPLIMGECIFNCLLYADDLIYPAFRIRTWFAEMP